MLMIICDKCKKPAGLDSYVLTTEVIHNPVPMSAHDRGSASLNVETQYKMCLCDKCYRELGFPNPYEVKETGEINFVASAEVKTIETAETKESEDSVMVETPTVAETATTEATAEETHVVEVPEEPEAEEKPVAYDNVDYCMIEEAVEAPVTTPQLQWVITNKSADGVKYYKGYNKVNDEIALTSSIDEAFVFVDSEKAIQRAISLNKSGKDFTVAPYSKGNKNEEN